MADVGNFILHFGAHSGKEPLRNQLILLVHEARLERCQITIEVLEIKNGRYKYSSDYAYRVTLPKAVVAAVNLPQQHTGHNFPVLYQFY